MPKRFIAIDGIDGAGKSSLQAATRAWFVTRNLYTFDVTEWSKLHGRLPRIDEIPLDVEVLLTAEPTYVGIGAALRTLVIPDGSPYSARESASAFALDRDYLYRTLLIPFRERRQGVWIIHDRGLLSSLAYQPLQSQMAGDNPALTEAEVLALPGNQTALANCFDAFVLLDVDQAEAQRRLEQRTEKQDNDRFSDPAFQLALSQRFRLPDVLGPLQAKGMTFHAINGNLDRSGVANAMQELLDSLAT